MDHIDLSVCRVFEIDPAILNRRSKENRLITARFTAMYIRHINDTPRDEIATMYERDTGTVRHAIKTVKGLLQYDKKYEKQFKSCMDLIIRKRAPYNSILAESGARVWTRADSAGKIVEGVITNISGEYFSVESFEDPLYSTQNRLCDGRITDDYETSLDIAYIQAYS